MAKGTSIGCRGQRLAALGSHCHPRAGEATVWFVQAERFSGMWDFLC